MFIIINISFWFLFNFFFVFEERYNHLFRWSKLSYYFFFHTFSLLPVYNALAANITYNTNIIHGQSTKIQSKSVIFVNLFEFFLFNFNFFRKKNNFSERSSSWTCFPDTKNITKFAPKKYLNDTVIQLFLFGCYFQKNNK